MQEVTFNNPPIVEALIDIKVDLPSDVNLEVLGQFHEKVRAEFPDKQSRMF